MIIVDSEPAAVSFVSNSAVFVVHGEYRHIRTNNRLHLRVFGPGNVLVGEESRKVKGLYAGNNVDYITETAVFDVSEYMRQRISIPFQRSDFSKTFIETPLCKSFGFEFFETYDLGDVEQDLMYYCDVSTIQGGFSRLFRDAVAGTEAEFLTRFLTWQPEKKVLRDEIDMLFFYSGGKTAVRKTRAVFADGSEETILSQPFIATGIVGVNSSFTGNGLAEIESSENKIVKYEISIVDENGVEWISKRMFYVNERTFTETRQFCFLNSLGAYDFVCFKGADKRSVKSERKEGFFDGSSTIIDPGILSSAEKDSGWMQFSYQNTSRAKAYMIELSKSISVAEVADNILIPLKNVSDKFTVSKSDEFLSSHLHSYQNSARDRFYSGL